MSAPRGSAQEAHHREHETSESATSRLIILLCCRAISTTVTRRKYKSMDNINNDKKALSSEQSEEILSILKARFEKNMDRHTGLEWAYIQAKLEASTEQLWSLNEMESTGGEPDV